VLHGADPTITTPIAVFRAKTKDSLQTRAAELGLPGNKDLQTHGMSPYQVALFVYVACGSACVLPGGFLNLAVLAGRIFRPLADASLCVLVSVCVCAWSYCGGSLHSWRICYCLASVTPNVEPQSSGRLVAI
jgi:hypothetical protein